MKKWGLVSVTERDLPVTGSVDALLSLGGLGPAHMFGTDHRKDRVSRARAVLCVA